MNAFLLAHKQGDLARAVQNAIRIICVPLARFSIRFGVPLHTVYTTLRSTFVEVATEERSRLGRMPTDSQIQAITGIRRKSIPQIRQAGEGDWEPNVLAKVLAYWTADPRFKDGNGKPAELPLRAPGNASFAALVKKVGKDLGVRAVLDSLISDGNVEQTDYGTVRLKTTVMANTKDLQIAVNAGAKGVAFHFETALKNIKNLSEGLPEREFDQMRYSLTIPKSRAKFVDEKIRRILSRAEQEIEQILDLEEVSPENIDLILMGAGFYQFNRNRR